MINFGCILFADTDAEAQAAAWCLEHAWAQWEMESCVERNGAHAWVLVGHDPDDGATLDLYCAHGCPGSLDDLMPDGMEIAGGDLDGLVIQNGRHRSLLPFTCPVDVECDAWSYETPDGLEYDAAVEFTPTGPVTSTWATPTARIEAS